MSELPIEHELIDGAHYIDGANRIGTYRAARGGFWLPERKTWGPMRGHLRRLKSVAVYEPGVPEPTGQGAVVRDRDGHHWVSVGRWEASDPNKKCLWVRTSIADVLAWKTWAKIPQPVEVLSEGVSVV